MSGNESPTYSRSPISCQRYRSVCRVPPDMLVRSLFQLILSELMLDITGLPFPETYDGRSSSDAKANTNVPGKSIGNNQNLKTVEGRSPATNKSDRLVMVIGVSCQSSEALQLINSIVWSALFERFEDVFRFNQILESAIDLFSQHFCEKKGRFHH